MSFAYKTCIPRRSIWRRSILIVCVFASFKLLYLALSQGKEYDQFVEDYFDANFTVGPHRIAAEDIGLESVVSLVWDGQQVGQLTLEMGRCSGHTGEIPIGSTFAPALNAADRQQMKWLLKSLVELLETHNMTYFLYSGSLIGSFRHHGMIPWDDDVDIAVGVKHKLKLKNLINSTLQTFTGYTTGPRWKYYYSAKPHIDSSRWSFPFIDISFFTITKDFVKDADLGWAKLFRYRRTDVFPLSSRPFWDLQLPVPRDTVAVLKQSYGDLALCKSVSWVHAKEVRASSTCEIPCDKLAVYYPFVTRARVNDSHVAENLMFDGRIIQRMYFPL